MDELATVNVWMFDFERCNAYHDRFDRAEAAEDEILKRMSKLGIEAE